MICSGALASLETCLQVPALLRTLALPESRASFLVLSQRPDPPRGPTWGPGDPWSLSQEQALSHGTAPESQPPKEGLGCLRVQASPLTHPSVSALPGSCLVWESLRPQ